MVHDAEWFARADVTGNERPTGSCSNRIFYLRRRSAATRRRAANPDAWIVEWKWERHPGALVRRGGEGASLVRGRRADFHAALSREIVAGPVACRDGTCSIGEVSPFETTVRFPSPPCNIESGFRSRSTIRWLAKCGRVMTYDVIELQGGKSARTAGERRRTSWKSRLGQDLAACCSVATRRRPDLADLETRVRRPASRERKRRGLDAEAPRLAVRRRGKRWRYGEMEDRPHQHGRGADLCAARQRQKRASLLTRTTPSASAHNGERDSQRRPYSRSVDCRNRGDRRPGSAVTRASASDRSRHVDPRPRLELRIRGHGRIPAAKSGSGRALPAPCCGGAKTKPAARGNH